MNILSAERDQSAARMPALSVQVCAVRGLTHNIVQLDLAAADGAVLPSTEAGAHIDVALPNGMVRQYSLMNVEHQPSIYQVAVKRDAASRGGSSWIFEKLRVGEPLQISTPRNHFPLNEAARHSVLIAGGIGFTPIVAMARRLRQLNAPFELHVAAQSERDVPLPIELEALGARIHCDNAHAGKPIDLRVIEMQQPTGTHFYCCGPAPMLDAFLKAMSNRPSEYVHIERFTAAETAAGGFQVELARSGLMIEVGLGQSILQAIQAAGVEVPHSCEQGVCGACETGVLEGAPDHRDSILTERERAAGRTMMICCSGSLGPRLKLDL